MKVGETLGAVAAWSARHARYVLAAALLVALAATFSASRLPIESGTDTLVDSGSDAALATEEVREAFGGDPVVVLVEGDLQRLLRPPDIYRLLNLEACLGGNVPDGAEPLPGPCEELAEMRPAKLVTGPATFLNQAAVGIAREMAGRLERVRARADRVAARAQRAALAEGAGPGAARARGEEAGAGVVDGFLARLLGLAARHGLTGLPSLGDPGFVSAVAFDPDAPPGTPKERLSYLLPSPDAAQIIVRLRPDLGEEERSRAIELMRRAVSDRQERERCAVSPGGDPEPCFALSSGEYTVSGAPVVVDSLTDVLRRALAVLLAVAILAMAATLLAAFRSPARLLPLGVALCSVAIAFGALGLAGGRLTLAAVAVLPILIGLAVDYAIQLQARFDEALRSGSSAEQAARMAGRLGAPIVGTACLATTAGFATLVLSPTPMVRDFGLLLVVGVGTAFVLALVAGSAALASWQHPGLPGRPASRRLAAAVGTARALRDRAGELTSRLGGGALRVAMIAPGRVIVTGVAIAAIGWVAGTRAETITEIPELVPQDLAEVRDLERLQEATGVSGEVDVIVTAQDITDPEVIAWMASLKRRILERGGYTGDDRGCREAEICPGPSLTDFIGGAEAGVGPERIDDLIATLPEGARRGVLEVDPSTGEIGNSANLAFGIGLMPLDRQRELVGAIRNEIDRPGESPPEGASAQVGGLPVIAAETASDLSGSRYWLALASIVAVSLILLAVLRSPLRVAVTVTPIVLATGWSSLMLSAMAVPLNPISAILSVLVVAIGTEFSVILSSRYRQQRSLGEPVGVAMARTYARTGAAVLASALTVIAGFAVLVASEIRMLRDFGLVAVVDLGVAVAGVMLLLPAMLVAGERLAARRRGEREPAATPASAEAIGSPDGAR